MGIYKMLAHCTYMNELCIILSAAVATAGLACNVTIDCKEIAAILLTNSCFMHCRYIRILLFIYIIMNNIVCTWGKHICDCCTVDSGSCDEKHTTCVSDSYKHATSKWWKEAHVTKPYPYIYMG